MSKTEISPEQKTLNVWAIILIVWSFYRAAVGMGLPIWVDEFISKPLVFLFPLFWYITKREKKSFLATLGFVKKIKREDILFGLGVGLCFMGMAVLLRLVKGTPLIPKAISLEAVIWTLSTIMAAITEQILMTGFVFKRLSQESKNKVRPFVITAFLFFFLHIPALFGADKIFIPVLLRMVILNMLVSITTSLSFSMKKNTVVPILIYILYLLSLPLFL